jgi:N-methylhydantoinase A
MRLSDFHGVTIKNLLEGLRAEATTFVRSCDAESEIESEYKVYMRYSGQGWEIPITLTPAQAANPVVENLLTLFETNYTALFGRVVKGMDVEMTVWSVNVTTPKTSVARLKDVATTAPITEHNTRILFDPALGRTTQAAEVLRAQMHPGNRISGPAVITEDETTIIVPASRMASILIDGCIDLAVKGEIS